MTESIVQNQISLSQTDVCKEIVTDGIYTVCTETGEVIDYDYDVFFVTNTEGLEKESKADKLYSHYQRHYNLMPNRGLGTIPIHKKQTYYTFAFRLSTLILNSAKKSLFTRIVQKVISSKIRDKLYIISAFAVKYCNVQFDSVIPIILNFLQDDEQTAKQKLSSTIKNLNYILTHRLYLSGVEAKAEAEIRRQTIEEYRYSLLSKYGYLNLLHKLEKIYNMYVIKIAVILLLLKDNRREEAIEVYQSPPKFKADEMKQSSETDKKKKRDYNFGFGRFIVEYEINGKRYVENLTYALLRTLVFADAHVYSFRIRLT
jgi:hypothetical protein